MELQGKIIAALEPRTGDSKRNPGEKWMSQEFVLQQHDQYQRKLVFNVWGADRLQRFNIQVGQEVSVQFDIDAREWNGRWFTDIRAYDVRQVDPASVGGNGAAPADPFPPQAPFAPAPAAGTAPVAGVALAADPFAAAAANTEESNDDLPF